MRAITDSKGKRGSSRHTQDRQSAERVPTEAGSVNEGVPRAAIDLDHLSRPPPSRDLVPVFMLIESDLFERLNAKAAARRTGYDMLLRTILREHIENYTNGRARRRTRAHSPARKRG